MHPWFRAKDARGSRHRFTGFNRHSLRNGFTVSFALSLVTGLVCHHRRCDADITCVMRRHHHRLDASVGASGPHDFAVHLTRPSSKAHRRPPHPMPNVRDDGQRPPYGHGTKATTLMIWIGRKAEYFCAGGWTAIWVFRLTASYRGTRRPLSLLSLWEKAARSAG